MGRYSSCDLDDINPETEKEENNYLQFVSNNINSWKKNNLNAFISKLSQGEKNNLNIFCIIEGNNGNEVTKFVQNHFLNELINEIKIKKDIKNAIEESFLKMNKLMEKEESMKEILDLRQKNNEEEIKKYKNIINDNKEKEINIFEEEDKEILDYTGCTLCLILIDSDSNKLYFANIGNSEAFIYKNNNPNDVINLNSSHRPFQEKEKQRIGNDSLIIDNKLYGVLKSARTFGNFAYNNKKKIISDEPDIQEYVINKEDKYIFVANEEVVNILKQKNLNVAEIIKKRKEIDENCPLEEILEEFFKDKISKYFFDNDTEQGFDNMTFTLIKLKNE